MGIVGYTDLYCYFLPAATPPVGAPQHLEDPHVVATSHAPYEDPYLAKHSAAPAPLYSSPIPPATPAGEEDHLMEEYAEEEQLLLQAEEATHHAAPVPRPRMRMPLMRGVAPPRGYPPGMRPRLPPPGMRPRMRLRSK